MHRGRGVRQQQVQGGGHQIHHLHEGGGALAMGLRCGGSGSGGGGGDGNGDIA